MEESQERPTGASHLSQLLRSHPSTKTWESFHHKLWRSAITPLANLSCLFSSPLPHARHVFLFVISMLELFNKIKTLIFFSLLPLPHISFPNAPQYNNAVFVSFLFFDSTYCVTPSFIPNPHQLPHHYRALIMMLHLERRTIWKTIWKFDGQ
jgi:hypothetical protein